MLVREDFQAERIVIPDELAGGGRVAAALVTLPNGTSSVIASVHLKAGGEHDRQDNLAIRTSQVSGLTSFFSETGRANVVMIGDFNFRDRENWKLLEVAGKGWKDVWESDMKCPKECGYTWDSF